MSEDQDTIDILTQAQALKDALEQTGLTDVAGAAAAAAKVVSISHTYDPVATIDFIDSVFSDPLAHGAHRLVAMRAPLRSKNDSKGFKPFEGGVETLRKKMERSTEAKAAYFVTSSCFPNEAGRMSHSKALFSAFHVLVLDDLGTKIPLSNLPELLKTPSYIIESSAGNFQYGYVLSTPITDYDAAQALCKAAVMAEVTDAGGAMPVKFVRLPDGINGKAGPAGRFQVKLIDNSGPSFTPEQIIDALAVKTDTDELVTWDKLVTGTIQLTAKNSRVLKIKGAVLPSSDDDEVLRWLSETGQILQDNGIGWVEIECPWQHSHSTGTNAAGYLPVGRLSNQRGFHCFHGGCKGDNGGTAKGTAEFLRYVLDNSKFQFLARTHDTPLGIGSNVYLTQDDKIYDTSTMLGLSIQTMKNTHPESILCMPKYQKKGVKDDEHEWRPVNVVDYFMKNNEYRPTVDIITSHAGKPTVFNANGVRNFNTFKHPPHSKVGNIDQAHVDKFVDFLKYLIHDDLEREYFIDWIACKVQDMSFRGCGIVMVTPTQGTGRSTLSKMLMELYGGYNAANVDLKDLVGSQFNDWEDKALVVVPESKDISNNERFSGYEALKSRVDTSMQVTTMNPKYGVKRDVFCTSSYLILSNHKDAISMSRGDRRFTVISNPLAPEKPAYFVALNDWFENTNWAENIYRWLLARNVTQNMHHPLSTYGKDSMVTSSGGTVKEAAYAVETVMLSRGLYAVAGSDLKSMILAVCDGIEAGYDASRAITHALEGVSISTNFQHRIVAGAAPKKARLLTRSIAESLLPDWANGAEQQNKGDLPHALQTVISDSMVQGHTDSALIIAAAIDLVQE